MTRSSTGRRLLSLRRSSNERGIPFKDLARKYEKEFMEDMKTLGCRTANVITRVSEVPVNPCFHPSTFPRSSR